MSDWDIPLDEADHAVGTTDIIGTALTWAACGVIWAIHLATFPLAPRDNARRSKSNWDEEHNHYGDW